MIPQPTDTVQSIAMAVPALRSKPPRCPRTRTIVDSTTAFSRRRARSGKDAKPNLEREVAFGSASGRHVALVLQDKYANRVAGLVAVGGASAREEQALRAKLRRGLGAAAVKTEEVVESVSPEPTIQEDAKPQRRCVAFTAAAAPRRTRLQMPEWLAVRTIAFVYRHSRFYLNQLRAAVSLETRRIPVGSFEAAPRLVKRDDSEDEDVKPFALPSAVSTSASEDIKPRLVEMSPSPPAVPTRPHPTAPHQHHSSSINAEDLDTKPFTSCQAIPVAPHTHPTLQQPRTDPSFLARRIRSRAPSPEPRPPIHDIECEAGPSVEQWAQLLAGPFARLDAGGGDA